MNTDALTVSLNRGIWGNENFRSLKLMLVKEAQKALARFVPLKRDSYHDNPIQILDFFSGAGGTSLGFAALNSVIPAFKMLGGCDINEVSATTYSRIGIKNEQEISSMTKP